MTASRRLLILLTSAVALLAAAPATASALCFGQAPTITGTAAGETIPGTAGDDVIEAGAGNDIVDGGGGSDRICGEGGDDTINGQGGNDQLDGGANGTAGDTVTFVDITVGQGPSLTIDLVAGTAVAGNPINTTDSLIGFENVTGSSTFDLIRGDAGPNVLEGLNAADGFTGRGGDDTLIDTTDSASNQDTALYPDASGAIQADLTAGTVITPNVGTDTLSGVPGVDGTAFDDDFRGHANLNVFNGFGGDDSFAPLGGADNVSGGSGTDSITYESEGSIQMVLTDLTPPNVTTATGNDFVFQVENVTGSPQNDTIAADEFDNVIDGLGGDDDLAGGIGTDTASFAGVAATVDANLQLGTAGGQGSDTLAGFENLTGSTEGGDTLTGNGGDNVLDGNAGANDVAVFLGLNQGVTASLVAGEATGQGTDTLTAIESLTGSFEDDTLIGDANNNVLIGLDGADQITAGLGHDTLHLGAGLDVVATNDGLVDSINCTGGGPDSGTVDTNPAENYTACDTDSDAVVDFLDLCPTTGGNSATGCLAAATPPQAVPVGTSTAKQKKKCKKGFVKKKRKGKKKCVRKKKKRK